MKSFGLAVRLWAGAITLTGLYIIIATIFDPDPWALATVGATAFAVFVAYFLLSPLLVPVAMLINISQKIPYSITAKIFWLAFILSAFNSMVIGIFSCVEDIKPTGKIAELYAVPTVAIFIMVFLYRDSFRKLYSQQIISTEKIFLK